MSVENQTGQTVYGWVRNSQGNWDRLRATQPGTVFAWDDEKHLWIECQLVPVENGRILHPQATL